MNLRTNVFSALVLVALGIPRGSFGAGVGTVTSIPPDPFSDPFLNDPRYGRVYRYLIQRYGGNFRIITGDRGNQFMISVGSGGKSGTAATSADGLMTVNAFPTATPSRKALHHELLHYLMRTTDEVKILVAQVKSRHFAHYSAADQHHIAEYLIENLAAQRGTTDLLQLIAHIPDDVRRDVMLAYFANEDEDYRRRVLVLLGEDPSSLEMTRRGLPFKPRNLARPPRHNYVPEVQPPLGMPPGSITRLSPEAELLLVGGEPSVRGRLFRWLGRLRLKRNGF